MFVIVSNLITVMKYFILQFLPAAFKSLSNVEFGWPGIPVTLFGETFKWNIFGYDVDHGGLGYFIAYMIAMVIFFFVNKIIFPEGEVKKNITKPRKYFDCGIAEVANALTCR